MYTLTALAHRYNVTTDRMSHWLKCSKAREVDGFYSVIDLVSWCDDNKISL